MALLTPMLFGYTLEDLTTITRSAYSHSQNTVPSNLATNVRAATFESGLITSFVSCIGGTISYWDAQTSPFTIPGGGSGSFGDNGHSLITFNVLKNSAPGATLFHRFSWDVLSTADQNFIINNSIQTLSISVDHFNYSTTSPNALVMDDFAYRFPYPVFNMPTGNAGYASVASWGAYNQIKVGNVQDSNYTHFWETINYCSNGLTATKNPPPIYGSCLVGTSGSNCPGDREVPYLVAPGWAPNAIAAYTGIPPTNCAWQNPAGGAPQWMSSSCIPSGMGADTITAGTSMSAPNMNGMVADLIGQATTLISYPEAVRAIMMLNALNVDGGYWNKDIDGLDGAGVVHGQNSISFAQSMTTVSPNNTAVEKGYYYGSYSSANFTSRTFNIKIPATKPAGQHLRIVLSWDSNPDLVHSTNDLSDLDLSFTSNAGTVGSSSWDSNNEIVDIPASDVTASGTYQCYIFPYTFRWNSGARSSSFYVTVVWGFVKDHAH